MGDLRYSSHYERIRRSSDPAGAIRALSDEGVIAALAAASRERDPYLANVLATEAHNRVRQMQAITRALGEGVFAVDAHGNVTFANDAAERLLGWTREEIVGRDVHHLLHHRWPDDAHVGRDPCSLERVLRSPETRSQADDFLRRDGRLLPVTYTSAPIFRGDEVEGAVVVFADDSARRTSESALRSSEERFRRLAEGAFEAIVIHQDGIIMEANHAVTTITGWEPAEILGKHITSFVAPESLPDVQRVMALGLETPYETKVLRKDGSAFVAEIIAKTIPLDDGSARIVALRDVTARKEAENELRRSRDQLHAILRSVDHGITVLDKRGTITFANSAVARNFGFTTPDALQGRDHREVFADFDLFDREGRPLGYDDIPTRVALRYGQATDAEVRLRRKGGAGEVWARVRATPVLDAEGNVELVAAVIDDISSQRAAQAEQERRLQEAQDAARQARFLADAAGALTASLDLTEMLSRLAQVAVPTLGDWCAISLVEPGGGERLVAATHVDPAQVATIRRAFGVPHPRRRDERGARPARTELLSPVDSASLAGSSLGPEQQEAVVHSGTTSLMTVPLVARERVLAFLTLGMAPSGRRITARDVPLAELVASRAALAIDNAKLLHAEQQARSEAEAGVQATLASLRALRMAKERYESLVRATAHAVWTFEAREGAPVPTAWLEISGQTAEEAAGDGWLDVVHPDDRARAAEAWAENVQAGSPFQVEYRIRWRGGDYRTVLVRSVPVRDAGGEIREWVAAMDDVTAEREAEAHVRRMSEFLEERVRERTRELAAANRELEAFSYSVSHDLRAPLRGVAFFAQALEEEESDRLSDAGRDYLRRLQRDAAQMSRTIENILTLSRAGREEIRREEVDLSAIGRAVLDQLRRNDPSRRVEIEVEDDMVVEADARIVRIVLENLLGNAWKYTAGRDPARIRFRRRRENGREIFDVEDNGVGFDMTRAERLFQPFQRLSANSGFEGTGIGLALAARVLRRLGGDIWARSAPEQGARFSFTLAPSGAPKSDA